MTGISVNAGTAAELRTDDAPRIIHYDVAELVDGVRTDLAKRVVDVALAVVLVVAVTPLLLLLAVAVRLSSPGPVLYRQERYGLGGRQFSMLKFRSMFEDADARLERLLASDAALADEYRACVKLRSDPRLTRIGGLLRRTSLDELPQLFNVIRGDMSLVGPRPVRDPDLEHYGPWAAAEMLTVPPGLTGLWQVSGRCRLPMDERVQLDVTYAREHTLLLDLRILLRTPWAVLRGSGAW